MKLIAILTPSYNRAKLLPRVFESLQKQTSKNFKWYIVDDGSTDDTQNVVENFKPNGFEILYTKKSNGGKHTALNEGVKLIAEKLTFILDSDDYLTDDAISIMETHYPQIEDNSFMALGFLKLDQNHKLIGKPYTKDMFVDTFTNQRINKNTYGDKAEVFKTEILKKYPFPVFENERFLSESTVWCKMSLSYNMVFINKPIAICEYQPDGLSANVHKTLYFNPMGAKTCYNAMSGKQTNLKYKVKYTVLYNIYSKASNDKFKDTIKNSNNKFLCLMLYLPSMILYNKYKKRYSKKS